MVIKQEKHAKPNTNGAVQKLKGTSSKNYENEVRCKGIQMMGVVCLCKILLTLQSLHCYESVKKQLSFMIYNYIQTCFCLFLYQTVPRFQYITNVGEKKKTRKKPLLYEKNSL